MVLSRISKSSQTKTGYRFKQEIFKHFFFGIASIVRPVGFSSENIKFPINLTSLHREYPKYFIKTWRKSIALKTRSKVIQFSQQLSYFYLYRFSKLNLWLSSGL